MSKEDGRTLTLVNAGRPGYLGKNKDHQIALWNEEFGLGNWRLVWILRSGQILNFRQIFEQYVWSYAKYFAGHPKEAEFLITNFSFAYDKELISRAEAFDPYALYNKPGRPNQFHHVALNMALEKVLRLPFAGLKPIQVREGKPGSDQNLWPEGWRWSPGRIPAANAELIPEDNLPSWWQKGSIEHLYQSAKASLIAK